MDGLLVAMDMLTRHCGTKKYRKRIFLITDGEKETNTNSEEMASLIDLMAKNDVRLNAITFDFANDLADNSEEESSEDEPVATTATAGTTSEAKDSNMSKKKKFE